MSGEIKQKRHHPKGLYLLFVTEMAECFSYYGMRSIFILYLTAGLFDDKTSYGVYGAFTGLVYLTPMLGGWISDKFWGNRKCIITGCSLMAVGHFLLFLSACFIKKTKSAENSALDPNVNNTVSIVFLVFALLFIIFGNGFFNPNMSVMVGDLYEPEDNRKDSAYTIFYMGINIGAFLAPFVCGAFAPKDEEGWKNPGGYKWGFLTAAIGMVLAVLAFTLFKNRFIKTPDGLQIGLSPDKDEVKARRIKQAELAEAQKQIENVEAAKDENENSTVIKNSPVRLILCIIVGIVMGVIYYIFLREKKRDGNVIGVIVEIIGAIVLGCVISLPLFIITDRGLNHIEKTRIGSIYIIAVFVIFFSASYEQAGSSLTNFARTNVNRMIGKYEFRTAWFQSINPIVIVILAPLFAAMWEELGKYHLDPFSPAKLAMGLIFLSIGYFVITLGVVDVSPTEKTSMWWLVALYLIHTVAELFLAPIGSSLVYRLSPTRLSSLLMAVWTMSSSISNVFAAKLANYSPTAAEPDANGNIVYNSLFGITIDTLAKFFTIFTIMSAVAGIVMFAFCPLLKRMMKGIH